MADPASFRDDIRLESIDPVRNRHRFFVLAWQRTLWGEPVLVRVWGRTGTAGRVAVVAVETGVSTAQTIKQLLCQRIRHGYVVVARQ